MIPINFIGGSHGQFLAIALNIIFADPSHIPILTIRGSWHNAATTQMFVARHFWRAHPQCGQNTEELPPLTQSFINIDVGDPFTKVLRSMYWNRVGEVFDFSAAELVGLTSDEFCSEWDRRFIKNQAVPRRMYSSMIIDSHKAKDYAASAFFVNGVATESSVIFNWPGSSANDKRRYNAEMLMCWRKKHTIIDVNMLHLYSKESFRVAVNRISSAFKLQKLVPDYRIDELQQMLVDSISEMPDCDRVKQLHDLSLTNVDTDISYLPFNDKIALWASMILARRDFQAVKAKCKSLEFPKSLQLLRELANQ